MECRDCARYDAENERCRDSKLNPQDWGGAVTVANVMGLRAICVFNDYRERLVRARGVQESRLLDSKAEETACIGG